MCEANLVILWVICAAQDGPPLARGRGPEQASCLVYIIMRPPARRGELERIDGILLRSEKAMRATRESCIAEGRVAPGDAARSLPGASVDLQDLTEGDPKLN